MASRQPLSTGGTVARTLGEATLYDRGVLRTRFTDLFGLEHPLLSAPMAMHSSANLAAAVSGAGALGSFGGIHATEPPSWIGAQAALVRERTDRPFAIGFITPFLRFAEGHFAAALEARPDAIVLSFSDPAEAGQRVKDAGIKLVCQVQTFADSDAAVAAGADVLIAQGTEAGGHTGTMTLLPLLAGVIDAHPSVPVLAAGGIGNGRTLAAALVAGADGACLGTSFLATAEATEIDAEHKDAIVASDGADTVFTRAYDIASGLPWPAGIGERVRRDAFTDEWTEREADLRANREAATPGRAILYGQSARFVGAVRTAADVVRDICAGAEDVLRSRPASVIG
jgi:nitronate monooxygenase